MQRLCLVLAMTAGLIAQVRVDEPKPTEVNRKDAGAPEAKTTAQQQVENLDKAVKLTSEQKQKILAILERRDQSTKDYNSKNAEKFKTVADAYMESFKLTDKVAAAKARKDYEEIYRPLHEIEVKAQQELDEVLTAEQQERLKEIRLAGMIALHTTPAKLSAEQTRQLKALFSDSAAHPNQSVTSEQRRSLLDAVQKILTPQQRAEVARHPHIASIKKVFARAKLTDAQIQDVEAACDELLKDKKRSPRDLYLKLVDKVNALLSDEQKAAMKQEP